VKESGEDLPIPLVEIADLTQSDGHINFFQEIEDGKRQETGVNAEHESEKKKEQEDYEKKIGLLVYLGQDSAEGSKSRPWYENIDRRSSQESASASVTDKAAIETRELKITKLKDFEDPLKDIRKYLHTPGVKKKYNSSSSVTASASLKRKAEDQPQSLRKHKKSKKEKKKKSKSKRSKSKKSKHHKSDSGSESGSSGPDSEEERKQKNLEKLRAERLTREREERRKADKLLANLRGETLPEPSASESTDPMRRISAREPVVKQKYNSQFNPHLARQNYDN
jgi:hypothetical protein